MPDATCSDCGLPLYLTKVEALMLNCSGTHFIEEAGNLIPVRTGGLRLGNPSKMIACEYGEDVQVGNFSDLYKCVIGAHTKIKHYVEIQEGVKVGKFCKIESYCFICEGVRIGNYCFIGAKTTFVNDKYPSAVGPWELRETIIEDNVSIGSGSVIMPVKIGEGSLIGAGSIVTKNIPPSVIAYGSPARVIRPI